MKAYSTVLNPTASSSRGPFPLPPRTVWVLAGALLLMHVGTAATYAEWQTQVWRPGELSEEAVVGRVADPDHDGLSNFAEYTLGRDPLRDEGPAITPAAWSPSLSDGKPGLAFRLNADATATEAALDVTRSDALGPGATWDSPDGSRLRVATRTGGAGREEVSVELAGGEVASIGFVQVAAVATTPPPAAPGWVWVEAEGPYGGESGPELSGGRMTWVGPGKSVEKPVRVPAAGEYTLWIRKFWNPQAIRWRVGNAPWTEVRSVSLTDLVLLSGNASRRVGWFNAGKATLPAGTAKLRLEVLPGDRNTTAYDCFLLTREPFTPRGRLKPGEGSGAAEPGWFAFEPPPDPLGYSPLDLRGLNERFAGEHGWIQREGDHFIHAANHRPVRFWAVNVGVGFANAADADLDLFARLMAKRGVNMVRIHGRFYEGSGPAFGRVQPEVVERIQRLVYALKREGIYTSLSIYFPLWVRLGPENPNLPGYDGGHPFALPYVNATFQELYRGWWRALLEPVNPHTGLPLKDDPAVAFLELINEDSTLFWTFDPNKGDASNLPGPQRALLERRFGDWLRAKYPGLTLTQIRQQRWQGLATAQDDFAAGRVGFRPLWNLARDRTPRDRDTAEFLARLMRDWYADMIRFLREEVGCRALIYGSNWKTASPQYLDPLDKWANAVGDFFDRHGYFGGLHQGNNASWNLEPGQTYDDRAAVRFARPSGAGTDFNNPLFDLAYNGRPSIITEVNWPLPNRFRADMVLLGAAYGALQGSDAIFWFAAGEPAWQGLPGKFAIQTPVVLGQFPAAALIYRQGLVQTGPLVVDLDLSVPDLLALKGTPLPAPQNFDQLRGADVPPGATLTNVSVIDSLAFLVGRVNADFIDAGPGQSRVTDLSPYVDRSARRVTSATGELTWDWGTGLVRVNAPAAQGATGFLAAAGRIELDAVTIESSLEYGSVLLVSLDGQPLDTCRKALLQVMSEEKPWQWKTDHATGPRKILNRGTVPLMVRELAGTVSLKRADAGGLTATPLDANGRRAGPPQADVATVTLAKNVFYYLIEQ